MRMKRETTIDLYMAIDMLQGAWMAVLASTIANCFRHASFGVSSGDSDDLDAVVNEDSLLDAGVVPNCDTFCTYVSADADAVTTVELIEVEIVREVTGVPNEDCDDSPEPNVGGTHAYVTMPTWDEAEDAVFTLSETYFRERIITVAVLPEKCKQTVFTHSLFCSLP
ncbi:hypothetical protein HPB48_007653 [Haemaphysalis longicornis]|uniref:Uncharacterized protein n=1 Tax=Haemaphysalis longicornis TaxID=44386 RepID=A0A9J6FU23_HAELO|nr:hypothetical protein HPB48_007653 [Haemaphysalis longicornis]